MKVAVSIPDDIFAGAEALAKRTKVPRSQIYARALKEYTDRHDPDQLTNLINEIVAEAGPKDARFQRRASYEVLKKVEW